jgi:hypothetical protein
VREGAAPRAGIAEGRADIVSCQGAAAALADRRGLTLAGEAAQELDNRRPHEREGPL